MTVPKRTPVETPWPRTALRRTFTGTRFHLLGPDGSIIAECWSEAVADRFAALPELADVTRALLEEHQAGVHDEATCSTCRWARSLLARVGA